MAHTVSRPSLERIQDLITAQLGVVRATRARAERCPTADYILLARAAEQRLNGLIAQWCSEKIREQADAIADGRLD